MFLIKSPPFDACISFDVIVCIYTHGFPLRLLTYEEGALRRRVELRRVEEEGGNEKGGLSRRVEIRRG